MDATMERPADVVADIAEVHDGKPLVRYSATEAALADLRARYAGAKFDLTTTAGDKAARAARLELVTLRTALEKRRKEFKAPALAFGQMIDAEAKRITGEIMAIEEPIDEQIKADEQRRAAEKAAREKAEAERKARLQAAVDVIRGFIAQAQAPGMTAARLQAGIDKLRTMVFPPEHWQEYHAAAQQAHAEALAYLQTAHAGAVEREAEAARLAAERAELERQQAAMRAEQERLAAEQRRMEELRRAEEAARAEAEAKAAAQAAAIAAAERKRLADDLAAERERMADDLAAKKVEPAEPAEPEVMVDGMTRAETEATASVAGLTADEKEAILEPIEPAALKGGDIAARLGFALQAEFLSRIGVPWRETKGAAKLWRESDWPLIKAALIKHIEGLA